MKGADPLVSVVIPCYNDGKYLKEAVDSVLKSTYPNIEIIISNDGSQDNTGQVGTALQNQHENVFYTEQSNKGPAAARNRAIAMASGDYILPFDADDLISERYIEKAVSKFENDPEVKVVYSEAEFFGKKTGKWKLPPFDRSMLARENMIFSCAMYKKEDYLACGGYAEEMVWGWEDWEFWISILKNGGKVYRIPEVCFYYRIKENSRRKGTNRSDKKKTVDLINKKHKEFIYNELNGPLRYKRSWSKPINNLVNLLNLNRIYKN